MTLPAITDGTVHLRPFAADMSDVAVQWLSGPGSNERSATDGGPRLSADDAQAMVEELGPSNAYAVVVEDQPCGWLRADRLSEGAILQAQLVLESPRLWNQGVGTRAWRLLQRVVFDHLHLDRVQVVDIPESAEAVRLSLEDSAFAMTARRDTEADCIVVDYALSAVSYQSSEQRLLLVHHGRSASEDNAQVLGAVMDPPLDAIGRAQAEALALCGLLYGVGECICSPAKRACATAEQAFAVHNIPIAISAEWQDRQWGKYSGKPAAELPRDEQGEIIDPPDGESRKDFQKRIKSALNSLPYGEHLAVVTHGAVIAELIRLVTPELAAPGGLRSGAGIAHGSISELRRGPEGWRVIRMSDDRPQQGRKPTATI